jgi:hypothetical protein
MKTILLIFLPAFGTTYHPAGKTSIFDDQNLEAAIRIKKDCGIPDDIQWNDRTRLVYGKQIEKRIKELDLKIETRRNLSRLKVKAGK